jgi:arylsulfatase A
MKYINIFWVTILILIGTSCSLKKKDNSMPNIILVMADDLGYEALGSYGGISYRTPNLDELAASGIRFTQAYAQPLCTNTRTELMTGKYIHHNWVAFGILDPAEKTFGHLMADLGYETCIVGKWQLQSYDPIDYPGSEARRGIGMHPWDAGFHEYCLWHTGHTEDKGSRYADPVILQNGEFLENTKGSYGPDIFTSYLNDFVRRNAQKPFFVYYPMALTHNPFVPTPDSEVWSDPDMRHEQDNVFFRDMVHYCDKILGDINENLENLGLKENTLLIFYSDNGTHQRLYSSLQDRTVQGGKGLTIDAGIRVPLIVSWEGNITGGVSDELVDACDILPTLLDAAGSSIPEGFISDGESFLPVLKGEEVRRRGWIYTDFNPRPGWDKENFAVDRYVNNKDYKLYDDGRFYKWTDDLLEERPLDTLAIDPEVSVIMKHFQYILDSIPSSKGI